MPIIDTNNKRDFTEHDFVALLLNLLYENGVNKIHESDLERKLAYYWEDSNFEELFRSITIEIFPYYKSACLYEAFYQEKNFSSNIWYDQRNSEILYLLMNKLNDYSKHEKNLSEDGKLKIRQLASELAKRYKIEEKSKVRLNIFGINPNCKYELVMGKYHGNLAYFELITDGDILKITHQEGNKDIYYTSPFDPNEAVQLEDNKITYVTLKNATYAVKQGICDGKILYCDVNTQILEDIVLEKIIDIANLKYNADEYSLVNETPYVRKLK